MQLEIDMASKGQLQPVAYSSRNTDENIPPVRVISRKQRTGITWLHAVAVLLLPGLLLIKQNRKEAKAVASMPIRYSIQYVHVREV